MTDILEKVIALLNMHREAFHAAVPFAEETRHPVPSDTRAWSQILVSMLTEIKGLARKKGADLSDGSDVKGANVWLAIDTPRFNGCLKAGRKGEGGSMKTLDGMPFLFFVMWDQEPTNGNDRCRVWVVRPRDDAMFRRMAATWYQQREAGVIRSANFQLHPPRNLNSDVFRNTYGNLTYPLLFRADWDRESYKVVTYDPVALTAGSCCTALK